MTTASDRPDGAAAPAQKSRRRRSSLSGAAQAASVSLSNALDDSPVLAPSPPPIEPLEDDDDATTLPGSSSRSRSRSSSSTRKSKRGTASGSGATRSRRVTAASSIIAVAKNARAGLLDGRDVSGVGVYTSSNNNNEDEGGDCFQEENHVEEDEGRGTRRRRSRSRSQRATVANGPELFALPGREQEATSDQPKGECRSGSRPVLPSRSRHYRQLSAGPSKSSIAHQHADRPPSRQRHAFPTHLIDANAFCAPTNGGAATELDTEDDVLVNEIVLVAHSSQPGVCSTKNERPPSRYMTKSNRRAQAGSASSHHGSTAVEANTTPPQTEVASADADSEADAGGRRSIQATCHRIRQLLVQPSAPRPKDGRVRRR